MSRWNFPGRDAGMRIFLITQMFPGVVMAIPLYILLDEMGLLDSLLGLVVGVRRPPRSRSVPGT